MGDRAWNPAQPAQPVEDDHEEGQLEGIGGWLIIPALYLVAVAFACAETLTDTRLPLLRPEIFVGNVVVLVGSVVLMVLFFRKEPVVPMLMCVFYVTVVAITALEYGTLAWYAEGIPAEVVTAELDDARSGLGYAMGHAILFIPYFLVSERVRNTFVG